MLQQLQSKVSLSSTAKRQTILAMYITSIRMEAVYDKYEQQQ